MQVIFYLKKKKKKKESIYSRILTEKRDRRIKKTKNKEKRENKGKEM